MPAGARRESGREKDGRRGNAILPTRAPASFKRMLGSNILVGRPPTAHQDVEQQGFDADRGQCDQGTIEPSLSTPIPDSEIDPHRDDESSPPPSALWRTVDEAKQSRS